MARKFYPWFVPSECPINNGGLMKAWICSIVCLCLLLIPAQSAVPSSHIADADQTTRIEKGYVRLPLAFEANRGQADPGVKFLSRGAGYTVLLMSDEAVLTLSRTPRQELRSPMPMAKAQSGQQPSTLRLKLASSNLHAKIVGEDVLSGRSNYFIGRDATKWQSNIPQYARVRYENVYPGVDLVYYGHQRELEYDFVIQPGADPSPIQLIVDGARKLSLDHGELVVSSSGGDLHLRSPHVYQDVNGSRVKIRADYVLRAGNEVGFRIGPYDRQRALVIDPVLSYSSYLGGSGDDRPFAMAVDSMGNAYVTGATTSVDFPTLNSIQSNFAGGWEGDLFVSKISADGRTLIFSTYLGGSSDDGGSGIAVDSSGVYLTGYTGSIDFPTLHPVQSTLIGWRNAIVTKINPSGDALLFSTYLGGGEDYGWGIVPDSTGKIHVRGDTRSNSFPVVNAIQPTLSSLYSFDCFVSELSADGATLLYSTYWGGTQGEGGVGIKVDAAGNTIIGGYTDSPDFPTVNPIQPKLAGGLDAYVTKFSADGQRVIYSTYWGGSADEWGEDFAADSSGNTYVVGYTSSSDYPTVNAIQPAYAGGTDGFVVKINSAGNALLYSTYLGGNAEDQITGVATDSTGNAYLAGYTSSTDFPVVNPVQSSNHGGRDAFLTKLSPTGAKILYSTYLGGSGDEGIWRDVNVAVDSTGNAYVSGVTLSNDFPITPGTLQQSSRGGTETFILKIAAAQPDTTPPVITISATPRVLWPPDGRMVSVAVSGRITDPASGIDRNTIQFSVRDEYGLVQPQGPLTRDSSGRYSFMVGLPASRKATDLNGRVFMIRVSARDNAGNSGANWISVTVPYSH